MEFQAGSKGMNSTNFDGDNKNCSHCLSTENCLVSGLFRSKEVQLTFTLRFFFKFVSQAYCSKIHRPNESPPENKKCSPGKVFGIKPPSNLATFEQEGPQMPGCEAVSTLHQPKNDMLEFFKFLQKKVSRLNKRNFLHLQNECRGFTT